jgi:hypothetical protein
MNAFFPMMHAASAAIMSPITHLKVKVDEVDGHLVLTRVVLLGACQEGLQQ